MKKLLHSKKAHHWFLRSSLIVVFSIVLIDTLSFTLERSIPFHRGAPTFTVCHAVSKNGEGERYFCSNDGCYSDEDEEMTVVGAFEDGNTCAGIAENLSH
ncbi:hypothetical protein EXS65_03815 [Candidatus Peribacteria bacterium]|nr:hypothetical protein [Candidatus Peribacteria bacterium]